MFISLSAGIADSAGFSGFAADSAGFAAAAGFADSGTGCGCGYRLLFDPL
jgi:2-methylisocitrate lyase-like PEP mutase family enzyme